MSQDIHPTGEAVGNWETALQYLKSGNRRFLDKKPISRELSDEEAKAIKSGQKPFAVIITCSDSRTAPEIFFDQRHGDLFVIRNAGNIVNEPTLGSVEFAVEFLKVPLIVVVGHSKCAAVVHAYKGTEVTGNVKTILDTISPAVKNCKTEDEAIRANADYVAELIKGNEVVKEAGAKVMSAFYSLETGEVTF